MRENEFKFQVALHRVGHIHLGRLRLGDGAIIPVLVGRGFWPHGCLPLSQSQMDMRFERAV
jgi:hypothetical protein